jgi:hypothetical protein
MPDAHSLVGRKVRSLKPDLDHDEYDRERLVLVGSMGVVWRINHVDAAGERHFDVLWDGGAWTVYSETEVTHDLRLL